MSHSSEVAGSQVSTVNVLKLKRIPKFSPKVHVCRVPVLYSGRYTLPDCYVIYMYIYFIGIRDMPVDIVLIGHCVCY